MSALVYTSEERQLAAELHALGAAAVQAEKQRLGLRTSITLPSFDSLDPWQQVGWFAIARQLLPASPNFNSQLPNLNS